jgi:hypothetical protein
MYQAALRGRPLEHPDTQITILSSLPLPGLRRRRNATTFRRFVRSLNRRCYPRQHREGMERTSVIAGIQ